MGAKRNYEINTIKELYARSGNQCAFPGCPNQLFADGNTNLSEICHIHGLNPGSARFSWDFPNEDLNKASNLILLCPYHHKLVDSEPENYTPETLISMKNYHEHNIMQTQTISFNTPENGNIIDVKAVIHWSNQNGYNFNENQIITVLNKILSQNQNTRVVLAKIIENYCFNNCIKMNEVLNELANCNEYQLSFQLQLLENMFFIEELRFTKDNIESLVATQDGYDDLSDNYVYKLYNGEWHFEQRGKLVLAICQYINCFPKFLDFLVNQNTAQLNK